MSKERQRVVYQEWVRDPNGKLLEKPPPRGSRPENNIIWGHTLEDFYWISRIPGVNVLTIWSRSMVEEYGENHLNVNGTREKGPEPRRLRPWPVLTLPEHVASSADLGYVDEGCGERHEHASRRMEDENKDATRSKAKAKLICPTLLSLECCPVLYCPPEVNAVPVKSAGGVLSAGPLVALVDAASSGATASTPSTAPIQSATALALTPAPPTEQKEEQKEFTSAAVASSSAAGTTIAVSESIEAASALAPPAPVPPTDEREPASAAEFAEHTASLQADTTTATPPPPPQGDGGAPALAHAGSTTPISATPISTSPSEDLMKMSLKTTSWDCIPEANAAAHAEPVDVDVELVGLVDPDVARVLDERRSALLGKAQVPAADTMDVDADTPATEQPESGAAPTTPQASSQTPGAETKEVALPKAEEGSNENDGADTKAPWGDTPPTDGAFAPAAPAEAMAVDAPKVQGGAPCAENVQAVTAADTATSCKDTPPTDTASAPAASAESSVEAKAVDAPKVQGAEKVEAAPALTAEAKVAAEPAAGAEPTTQAEPTRVVPETKAPPPTPEPPFFHDLPTLEEFIPEEYFPDILYVNDPDNRTAMEYYHSRYDPHKPQSEESVPRKYKRVWPRFARDTEPATAFNTDPDCASIKLPAPPTGSISAEESSPPSRLAVETNPNLRIARLNLSSAPILGTGNHSVVCRAALCLPPPLSVSAARSPTGEVAVAAKTAHSGSEARALLRNEGKMYDAFPKHLQEDWCGLNLVAPIAHPVPVGAVVPKFYGYYVPVMEDVERAKQRYAREWKEKKRREAKERRLMKKKLDAARRAKEEEDAAKAGKEKGTEGSGEQVDGDKMDSTKLEDEDEEEDPVAEAAAISRDFMQTASYKAWHRMSPILLLEECGKPIKPEHFTPDERSECYSLALRLHFAEFTQNSFYVRNILRQPGPLTVAPSARSDKTPSFRIIDHGRGEHWPLMLEAAKKEIEIEQQRRKERKATLASMDVPTEAQMKRRVDAEEVEEKDDKEKLEAATKRWWELQDYEVRKAHSELQIPDFDY